MSRASTSSRVFIRSLSLPLAVALLCLAGGASPGQAATRLVATSGANAGDCTVTACATMTYALTQAVAGDTIALGAGDFTENVVIDKSVTLAGAGQASTTIRPALSAPNPIPCPGSLCAGASNVLLVQANAVVIHDLTVDGDNTGLTSGIVVGGADLDARNGIITNHGAGTFNGLDVHDVTVRNLYLRGIYASSAGTFTLTRNTIQNVQADPASICVFNFGGSGTMSANTASGCNDAFSANWSTGTQFLGNTVTASLSAVHTDNASGPATDILDGNQATGLGTDSYAFWVFAPYVAPVVRNNTVTGTTVGLGAFGTGLVTPTFENNVVDCQGRPGSLGAWVSTTLFQFGSRSTHAVLQSNRISNCATGIDVEAEPNYPAQLAGTGNTILGSATAGVALVSPALAPPGSYTVQLDHNRIFGNAIGLLNPTGQTVIAPLNWWGCNAGPGGAGALGPCDTVSGAATLSPWLVLATPTVTPASFDAGSGSAAVATDVAHDSAAAASPPGVPDATPLAFTTTIPGGVLTPANTTTVAGQAASTLTALLSGSGVVCASVDNERLCSATVVVAGSVLEIPTLAGGALVLLAGLLALAALAALRR